MPYSKKRAKPRSMSPTTVSVFAPAKINLALHVTGQRDDGYHLLDSLVAFATVGDRLRITHGSKLSLAVEGPEAGGVPATSANLAMRAAALVSPKVRATLKLEKRLPSASGIGGGSADAAAAYRGLSAFMNSAESAERSADSAFAEAAFTSQQLLLLGADIPMCLASRTAKIRGIGERVEFAGLPPVPAVLANPRIPVSTPSVFNELSEKDNSPMPDRLPVLSDSSELIHWLHHQRNDLEAPARRIAPIIGDVLQALRGTEHCGLARMSGSGATCFGLFTCQESAVSAVEQLRKTHPDWWIVSCELGDQSEAARPQFS